MKRDEQIERLRNTTEYDVVIIGGGATGLGCAVDAASRGLKTLLLEKHDFAKGTSSRATKLVHGGVRYLAQGNVRLVREALLERGRLLANAPHVCHSLGFVVPAYKWWQKYYYGIGLWIYEFLSFKLSLGKTKIVNAKRARDLAPGLSPDGLKGGVYYVDGQFDDSRLAVNLAQTAAEQGATVVNHCGVIGLEIRDGKITGIRARDEWDQSEFLVSAKSVINATGVFGDSVLRMADADADDTIAPSQGIHLVVDRRFFAGSTAMMIPKTDDGRVLFAIPWHDKVLIGTTDTPVNEISKEPSALPEEVEFIISHFNRYTTGSISLDDIRSVFVGLRPLAKTTDDTSTSVMPRDHVIKVLPSGLIHVTGGKWTTYRNMAEEAVDRAVEERSLRPQRQCQTKELKIHGSVLERAPVGPEPDNLPHLGVYGSDAIDIRQQIDRDSALAQPIHPDHPYTVAEVVWSIENEMACTVEDVLARRIRLLFLDARAAIAAAPSVARLLAQHHQQDAQWESEQVDAFTRLARGYLLESLS